MNTTDILYRYIPLAGGASVLAFSVNVMDASVFKSLFKPSDHVIANSLWFNAHLGVGLYIYRRRHIRSAPQHQRIMYSVFGTMIFNFGTVLFWATTKTLLPKNNTLRILFGLGSGVALMTIGRKYLKYVDSQMSEE